jgi:hypothetical protein
MQRLNLWLVLLLAWSIPAQSFAGLTSDPQNIFVQDLQADDLEKAQRALDAWAATGSGTAELSAARGLWWHASAHRENDEAAFFQDSKRAMEYLQKALDVIPTRLDLRLEILELHLDLGENDAVISGSSDLCRNATQNSWLWWGGAALPADPRVLIPARLEEMNWELVRNGEKGSIQLALKLASLAEQYFPNHPGAYRIKGRIELGQERFQESRKDLVMSLERDSEDSETLLDLGQVLWELEKDSDSQRVFNHVIELNNDPDAVHRARLALEKMEENP